MPGTDMVTETYRNAALNGQHMEVAVEIHEQLQDVGRVRVVEVFGVNVIEAVEAVMPCTH